jgi:uncharacterized protein YjiK
MAKKGNAPRVQVVSEHVTAVTEASGVAPLADGSFLLVDDEEGVFHFTPGREPEPIIAGRGFADLEGVCASHDGSRAWVLAERDGGVWVFRVDGSQLAEGKKIGALPRLNSKKNAGWEGLAFAPEKTLADSPRLVAVHQSKPRRVAILDPDSLAAEATFSLPKSARKKLDDLNDVAVHPTSGDIVVLSGKAGRLARLVRTDDALELVDVYALAAGKDDVPEGLAYDASGRLWVVWDGSGRLREIRLP